MTQLATPPETRPVDDLEPDAPVSAPLWGRGILRKNGAALVVLAVLAVLVIMPMILVLVAAIATEVPRPGNGGLGALTLDNLKVLTSPDAVKGLVNSLILGLGATAIALVIGATLAFICARTDAPWRRFIFFIGMAPVFVPALVGALAWSLLASPSAGFVNIMLADMGLDMTINIYSIPGLIFVLGLFYAPYVFMLVHSSLSMMNADLEEASTVHGASLKTMFRTVTLPLAMPALLGSGILVFALSMENFPVAAVLGNPAGIETLPTYIFRLMGAAPAQANAAAGIAILLTLGLVFVTMGQQWIVNRRKFTTMTGKGARPRQVPLRGWRWPATIFALVYFLLAIALPMGALFLAATQDSPYLYSMSQMFQGGMSFDNIVKVASAADFQKALVNSVVVAVVAAFAGTTISFSASYIRYRTKSRLGALLEQIATAPLAIPSIVLGMGILWTWLSLPIPIYGTLIILAVACVAVALPQGYRSISSSMLQLHSDLEDSAVMLGARRSRAIVNVTVPLMRVGIVSTFLLLLMLAMRELSASLFLFTSDTRILSILVFDNFENGQTAVAASISVLFVLVIAVLAVLAQLAGNREKKQLAEASDSGTNSL
ncbi:iron(III) transport system permease protein [Rhodococcus rhodochrous J3]|uniref:Iron(III) transport system permease protein n=1 Tax=Rhodococcus rhodochrous J3 TaxID=903528 RepID=A0ABY1MEJ5_RHORH|nr:iron ABC transporter permease [Rhodococcus rhodochrous]MBF4481315.1 iron ABC transporter permease [Rhodococcus rhodochrous]SMG51992.1 iron(III) transport system permease protein [Rhodococcus rhodochrous J3]